MPAVIKPTLYIGLGTTGAQILGYLQEMIFEEYNNPSFPVIQLLSFITAGGDKQYLSGLQDRESIVHLQVPDTAVVKAKIQNPVTAEHKALKDWIPDELFVLPGFTDGSKNFRVAGRLHLWVNFATIQKAITQAALACTSVESRDEANRTFHERLTGEKGVPREAYVDDGLNIFVVGTLSGGTCSGMVPEFGFLAKNAPAIAAMSSSGANNIKVMGVFTVPNSAQTSMPGFETYSANSYAALSELNFHFHRASRKYDFCMPDGRGIDPGDGPYDYLYIMSPTTMRGDSLTSAVNEYDHNALLQMIAMSLFMDVFTSTYSTKEGMRDNYRAATSDTGDTMLFPDSRGRKPRIYMSFGVASISTPKYRIARAAAAHVASRVMDRWLNPKVDDLVVEKYIKQILEMIKQNVVPMLTKRKDSPSIEEDISAICQRDQKILLFDANRMKQELRNFPGRGNSLEERFYPPEGDYYRLVENQFRNVVGDETRRVIREFYYEIRGDQNLSIPAVEAALKKLKVRLREVQQRVKKLAGEKAVRLAVLTPYFDRLRNLERGWTLKIMLLRSAALEERKREIMSVYEDVMQRAARVLRSQFVDKLIDIAIDEVDEILNNLTLIIIKLKECHNPTSPETGLFSTIYKDILRSLNSPPRNTRYLFPRETPENEVEAVVENFNLQEAMALLASGVCERDRWTIQQIEDVIISLESVELGDRMLVKIVQEILTRIRTINVMEETVKKWSAELSNLVSYSAAYIEMDNYYIPGGYRLNPPGGQMWATVFAPADNEQQIQRDLLPKLPTITQSLWKAIPLGREMHRMIFFCEEPFFSTTFMSAYPRFKSVYEKHSSLQIKSIGQPCRYWTDKRWMHTEPDIDHPDRKALIAFLLEMSLEVARGARGQAKRGDSDDAIEPDDEIETRLFKYRDPGGRLIHYFEMPASKDKGPVMVTIGNERDYDYAAEKSVADDFIPYLKNRISDCFKNMGIERFQQRWDQAFNRQAKERDVKIRDDDWSDSNQAEYEELAGRFRAYLAYLKKEIWGIEPTGQDKSTLRGYTWLYV